MNIETYQITVSDIEIDVVRKNIKNLYLAVHKPSGRVRLATPLRVDDEALRFHPLRIFLEIEALAQ